MYSLKTCQQIIETVISYGRSRRLQVEVMVASANVASIRFVGRRVSHHSTDESSTISVRVLLADGRQASLDVDRYVSPRQLRELVDSTYRLAQFHPRDRFARPLPRPKPVPLIDHFDWATAHQSPGDRIAIVRLMVEIAEENVLTPAGFYETDVLTEAMGNTNGLFLSDTGTEASCSITMTGPTSSGWAKDTSMRASALNPIALAKKAAASAKASSRQVEIPPSRCTAILTPETVLDLFEFMLPEFCGTAYVDRTAAFQDALGERVLGSNITIRDDYADPRQWGACWDGEGMPATRVTVVKNGILQRLWCGRRSAHLLKMRPTGHGSTLPSFQDEEPEHIILEGGDTSVDEMIAQTKNGIFLPRVWYVRSVDERDGQVTGVTRDGPLVIQNGNIVGGLKFNWRFNQSLIDMLRNVVALGPAVLASGEEAAPQVVPPMLVDGFNFDSVATAA
jgi:predicted Zn-dependent protease